MIRQFDNIGGYQGFFLSGPYSFWVFAGQSGRLSVHTMWQDGQESLTKNVNFLSFLSECFQIRPGTISGGHYGIVALEKYNDYLQGSVSWQIYLQDQNLPVKDTHSNRIYGRRLNIAYYVPWK